MKAYPASGEACRLAITLTSVSKAISSWTNTVETERKANNDKEQIITTPQEPKLVGSFVGEVAIDVIRWFSQAMLASVTLKKALWIKPRSTDSSFQTNWDRKP